MDLRNSVIFQKGAPLSAEMQKNFTGNCYVADLVPFESPYNVIVSNVTFEPESRNHWHIHPAGQILLVTGGCGWYQEEGKSARPLTAGDVLEIPGGVKHWHGATKDSWFSHIAIEPDVEAGPPQWCEEVAEDDYNRL